MILVGPVQPGDVVLQWGRSWISRGRAPMRVLGIAVALFLSLGAGADDEPAAESAGIETPTETSASSPSTEAPIVGSWQRVTTCDERVAALERAGLGEFAVEHAAG